MKFIDASHNNITKLHRLSLLYKALRIVLGIILVTAAAGRVFSLNIQFIDFDGLPEFPISFPAVIARLVVPIELVLGFLLLAGIWQKVISFATFVFIFTIALFNAYTLYYDWDSANACFRGLAWIGGSPIKRIILDIVLIFVVGIVLKFAPKQTIEWEKSRWIILTIGILTISATWFMQRNENIRPTSEILIHDNKIPKVVNNRLSEILDRERKSILINTDGSEKTVEELLLESQYLLFVFFSTVDCMVCLSTMDRILDAIQQFEGLDFRMIGVVVGSSLMEGDKFLKESGYGISVMLLKKTSDTVKNVPEIPTPFLVLLAADQSVFYTSMMTADDATQQRICNELSSIFQTRKILIDEKVISRQLNH